MAAGQSVSNRRAERSSYAESRARRHGDGSAPLCYAPSARGGGPGDTRIPRGTHSLSLSPDIWRARAPRHPTSLTDGSPGVPSPRRRRRHRRRCQFRLSRSACSSGGPRGGQPVIPELRLARRSEGRINS